MVFEVGDCPTTRNFEDKEMTELKIYVACIAAYNSGHLHGVWIDATEDLDSISEQIEEMLFDSPVADAEEFAIHDYDDFAGYQLSEGENIETVHEIACFIEERGKVAGDLLNHFCGDLEEATNAIEHHYCGCFTSLEDYAREFTENTTDIPEHLEIYIDYERMGRDWEMSGDIFTIETDRNEVHIFYSR